MSAPPLPLGDPSALLVNNLFDALQRRIGSVMCLEFFAHLTESSLQSSRGLLDQIMQKLRSHIALLGEPLPAGGCDQAGIALTADIKGEMIIDALDGAGAYQVIEWRQTGRGIGQVQQGEILGVAVRVARQHVEDLPAQQVLRVDGRFAGGLLHQTVTLREGRPAVFLVFFLMSVTRA